MYTVTELANRCDTTPHAVRYYTRKGLLRPKRNPDNGYRLYRLSEIAWLKREQLIWPSLLLPVRKKMVRENMHQKHSPRLKKICAPGKKFGVHAK